MIAHRPPRKCFWTIAVSGVSVVGLSLIASCADATSTPNESAFDEQTLSVTTRVTRCGPGSGRTCPLQEWMRANATGAMIQKDGRALARVFERIAEIAPPEYDGWSAIAKGGAEAAAAGDVESCRVACTHCHDAFRASYRAAMRGRPID